jgi:hypothetical protein
LIILNISVPFTEGKPAGYAAKGQEAPQAIKNAERTLFITPAVMIQMKRRMRKKIRAISEKRFYQSLIGKQLNNYRLFHL